MAERVYALSNATKEHNGKLILAIGGASDCVEGLNSTQTDKFAE